MKLPKSFYAHRVTEAIDSIVKYVDQARDLAEDIKPARTVGPAWSAKSAPARPRLSSVTEVAASSTGVSGAAWATQLSVAGQTLSGVVCFALIPKSDLSDDRFLAKRIDRSLQVRSPNELLALVDLTAAPAGTYHAWIRDQYGQEDLLVDALDIGPLPWAGATTAPSAGASPPATGATVPPAAAATAPSDGVTQPATAVAPAVAAGAPVAASPVVAPPTPVAVSPPPPLPPAPGAKQKKA